MVELMATTARRKGPTLAKTARMGHPTSKAKLQRQNFKGAASKAQLQRRSFKGEEKRSCGKASGLIKNFERQR
jgi:hypothetical protein